MLYTNFHADKEVCVCNHFTPDIRVLRSVPFNRDLASFYDQDEWSANALLDWVHVELNEHRTGTLFDPEDQPIDLDSEDGDGDRLLDRVFGADPCRFINRYRERARVVHHHRLKLSAVLPVLILHHARQNWLCRTSGHCSRAQARAN